MNKTNIFRVRNLSDGSLVGFQWKDPRDGKWYHLFGHNSIHTIDFISALPGEITEGFEDSVVLEEFTGFFSAHFDPIYVNDEIEATAPDNSGLKKRRGIVYVSDTYILSGQEDRTEYAINCYSLHGLREMGYEFHCLRIIKPLEPGFRQYHDVVRPKPLNETQKGEKLSIEALASLGFTKTFIPVTEVPPLAEFAHRVLEESRFKGQMDKVVTRHVAGDRIKQTLTIAIICGAKNQDEFLVLLDTAFIKKVHLVIELVYLIIDHLEIMDPELNELKSIWDAA